jgi:hypothetical protein
MRMISPSRCARALFFCLSFLGFDSAFAQHVEPVPGVDVYSDSVGATPASFRVDESGSATYSMPLVPLPGSGGVSHKLALAYDARAGWGAMGVGWQLSGLSSISRCKKTVGEPGHTWTPPP